MYRGKGGSESIDFFSLLYYGGFGDVHKHVCRFYCI